MKDFYKHLLKFYNVTIWRDDLTLLHCAYALDIAHFLSEIACRLGKIEVIGAVGVIMQKYHLSFSVLQIGGCWESLSIQYCNTVINKVIWL